MGSAAQPRKGTAPKELAASAVPACFRNLRRLDRFDRVLSATSPLDAFGARSLVMPSPLILRSGRGRIVPPVRFLLVWAMLARLKIVYNKVFNTIIARIGPALTPTKVVPACCDGAR